jgi:branched-chain amino acid transport system substrate-binding protein
MKKQTISKSVALSTVIAGYLVTGAASADDPIKIGVLEDQSGNFAAVTQVKVNAIELAAEEINAAGGIAGRMVELVVYDTQSDDRRYQELMRRVLQRDQVDTVFAGFASSSREAYRPIVNQFDGLAFYNNQYEGGVCDANMIVTGAVPEQQFSTLIPWMIEEFGPKVYTIAADYNFGQISAEWVRQIVGEAGGQMVGEEFIPLDVSQFSQTIQNIQREAPDFVVTLLVGSNQASYYQQAASASLGLPMASSVNVGQGYEHKRFSPPSLADMYVTTNFIEEVDSPAANEFVERFYERFPEAPYVNQEAANSYIAMYLYKQMVERADGSTDKDDLRTVIAEGDVCFDGPSGTVCLDPKSQHMSHNIYLAKVGDDHEISFPQVWESVEPYWLGENGCDLTQNDPSAQYTPSNPPN